MFSDDILTSDFGKTLVPLANGDRIPFAEAHDWYEWLRSRVICTADQWDVVRDVRMLALGNQISASAIQKLRQRDEGLFVGDSNELQPSLKSVILSSVRGQDADLKLDSPFSTSDEHLVSEFLFSQSALYTFLADRNCTRYLGAPHSGEELMAKVYEALREEEKKQNQAESLPEEPDPRMIEDREEKLKKRILNKVQILEEKRQNKGSKDLPDDDNSGHKSGHQK